MILCQGLQGMIAGTSCRANQRVSLIDLYTVLIVSYEASLQHHRVHHPQHYGNEAVHLRIFFFFQYMSIDDSCRWKMMLDQNNAYNSITSFFHGISSNLPPNDVSVFAQGIVNVQPYPTFAIDFFCISKQHSFK